MPFVKTQKSKAYFKRFQTQYRRRREGRTDYHQRRKLVIQDKNKYQAHKFRFIARFSNQYVTCQVAYSQIDGDHVVASAKSSELPRYGLKVGLKNYSAAYATGLLCARRLLNKFNLNETFEGQREANGEWVQFEDVEDMDHRPFRCYLDVGLRPTKNGARVFAAMKGAVDGGLHIPHKPIRFPGYEAPEDKAERKNYSDNFNPEALRDRILGKHVADYMREMQEEDADQYKRHFADYIKNGISADNLEDLYRSVHQKIRENPAPKHSETHKARKEAGAFKNYPESKKLQKITYEERKQRVMEKKQRRMQELLAMRAGDDSESEEED